jgi:type IV secretion system protein VirB5
MRSKITVTLAVLLSLAFAGPRPAQAQFAVIDVGAIAQLIQEVSTLEQDLAVAKNELTQAQTQYASMTGSRGMQNLLGGINRNYLPQNWTQLSQIMSGSSGGYPGVASSYSSLVTSNAVMGPAQVAALSPSEQAELQAQRSSVALLQTTTRTALQNASDRFASLQQLISAIGQATDQKGALDLETRIAAEEAMLQDEQTKLQILFQVAQSQEWAQVQQSREQSIIDQGSLEQLPAMGL